MQKNIILTGYMGVGKTTIGAFLAKELNVPFYDLDQLIEQDENMSVKNIFKTKGEIYFRKIEHTTLNNFIANNSNYVLAFGGGTPCYANNHLVLQQPLVFSFYLKASIAVLSDRLMLDRDARPLLSNEATLDELKDQIAKSLFDRSYFYHQAKKTINVDNKSVVEITNEIKQVLL